MQNLNRSTLRMRRIKKLNRTQIRNTKSSRFKRSQLKRRVKNDHIIGVLCSVLTILIIFFMVTYLSMTPRNEDSEVALHPVNRDADYKQTSSYHSDDKNSFYNRTPVLKVTTVHDSKEKSLDLSYNEDEPYPEDNHPSQQQALFYLNNQPKNKIHDNNDDCGDCGECSACDDVKNEVVLEYDKEDPFANYESEFGNYVFEVANAPSPKTILAPSNGSGSGSGTNVSVNIGDFNVQGGNAISESNSNAEAYSSAESFSSSNARNDNNNSNENQDNDDRRFTAGVYSNNDNQSNAVSKNNVNPNIAVDSKNNINLKQDQSAKLNQSSNQNQKNSSNNGDNGKKRTTKQQKNKPKQYKNPSSEDCYSNKK